MPRVNLKRTANLLLLNTPFTQNFDYYFKNLPQDSNRTVMLIWCLKQVKDFTPKFPINGVFC